MISTILDIIRIVLVSIVEVLKLDLNCCKKKTATTPTNNIPDFDLWEFNYIY